MKNVVTVARTVWCDKCAVWVEFQNCFNNRDAIKNAKKQGWAQLMGLFLCPDCLNDAKKGGE